VKPDFRVPGLCDQPRDALIANLPFATSSIEIEKGFLLPEPMDLTRYRLEESGGADDGIGAAGSIDDFSKAAWQTGAAAVASARRALTTGPF
jgi:hypothetical protein